MLSSRSHGGIGASCRDLDRCGLHDAYRLVTETPLERLGRAVRPPVGEVSGGGDQRPHDSRPRARPRRRGPPGSSPRRRRALRLCPGAAGKWRWPVPPPVTGSRDPAGAPGSSSRRSWALPSSLTVDGHGGQDQPPDTGTGRLGQAEPLRLGDRRQGLALRPAGPAVQIVDQSQVPQGLLPGQRGRRLRRSCGRFGQGGARVLEAPGPQTRRAEMGQQESDRVRDACPADGPGSPAAARRPPRRPSRPLRRTTGQPGGQRFQQRTAQPDLRQVPACRSSRQTPLGAAQVAQTVIEVAPGQVVGRPDEVRPPGSSPRAPCGRTARPERPSVDR